MFFFQKVLKRFVYSAAIQLSLYLHFGSSFHDALENSSVCRLSNKAPTFSAMSPHKYSSKIGGNNISPYIITFAMLTV